MQIHKSIRAYNYLIVYLLIILVADAFLLQLPLAGMLGYEYSAINSILLTIISGIYTITFARKDSQVQNNKNRLYVTSLLNAYATFLALSFLTGLFGSLSGLACSISDGILFFIVITIPSVITGGALGLLSFYLIKRFRIPLFVLFLIIVAAVPAFEIYFNPQIYFYNPLIGYFPGTIYDEGLSVNSRLIFYRGLNLCYFSFIFLTLLLLKGKYRKAVFVLSAAAAIIFIAVSPFLEFSTSEGRMKGELNRKIETEHFNIYFDPQIDETFQKVIALHHEFYYSELYDFFRAGLKEKITSFVFVNSGQKGELLGSENADVAKPWLKQIYTTQESYNRSLKHELAHIFSGEYAEGILKVAEGITPALIEGIAVAAHPVQDEYNVDYLAALAYNYGYKVKLKNLFSYSGFFTSVSTLSYVYAGSFIKYLIENYGINKFRKFYSDPDFEKIYNKTLPELEKEFTGYLISIETAGSEHTANYYFGRKSIFQKICPRYVADRIKKASELYYNRQFTESAGIFRELYRSGESYVPLAGWINSLIKLNMYNKADSILIHEINKFEGTGYYYNLEFKLADIAVLRDDYTFADSLYREVIKQMPNRPLYFSSVLRRNLLVKEGLLKTYIEGNDFDRYTMLKDLNRQQYYYSTFPAMVEFSGMLNEDYSLFLKQFEHTLIVNDYNSAYAVYRLSLHMLEKLDFEKARRMAALAARFKEDSGLNYLNSENMKKMSWFRYNASRILDSIKVKNNPD
jgi:hypothetical protein